MEEYIPNSFQVPNIIIDEVMAKVSSNAFKCYMLIVRKTTGWKKEWDKISTTQLMKFSGIKRKETIYKSIKELEDLNLIEADKSQGVLTKYRLVLKNRTGTDKPSETSTKKPYPTKHNNKTKSLYDLFIQYLKENCKYKTKVTKTKEGEKLFKQIEDKKQLVKAYISHQNEKKEYSVRITAFMEDYETVYKQQEIKPRYEEVTL